MYIFDIPNGLQALHAVGQLQRYGTILKDVTNGRIVGHLKEAGAFSQAMAMLPVNPLSTALEVGSMVSQNAQLSALQAAMGTVQILSGVGAVASVANLGVSVAGFAVVLTKLKRMDAKLDQVLRGIDEVRLQVEQANFTLDAIQSSRLRAAADALEKAEGATTSANRARLLGDASRAFGEQRNYYYLLLEKAALWDHPEVPIDAILEAHARYVAVAMGELQAEFLQGDMGAYRRSVEMIAAQHAPFGELDGARVLRTRSDRALEKGTAEQLKVLSPAVAAQLAAARAVLREDHARIETMTVEADYIERRRLDPYEYLADLKQKPDGIVLLAA